MISQTLRSRWIQGQIGAAMLLFLGLALSHPSRALAQVQWTPQGSNIVFNGGNVGINVGINSPQKMLHIVGAAGPLASGTFPTLGPGDVLIVENNATANVALVAPSGSLPAYKFYLAGTSAAAGKIGYDFTSGGSIGAGMFFWTGGQIERMRIDSSGNVGIGTTTPTQRLDVSGNENVTGNIVASQNINAGGNIRATGTIYANYSQDVAEWVPASRSIAAGTVVILDPSHSNRVMPSNRSYDTAVAGVVSASPGLVLGIGGEGQVMVATTGRVRVKVDASKAPINVGDLLVTSDKEGVAMKSVPVDLGGAQIHRPGTLIGKALEPLERGVGEVLVLLSLQ